MSGLQKFLFLLGQVGMMCLARFFFQWILKFAATSSPGSAGMLFSASTVGAILLAFRIFDGVTDPVAGSLSDWWTTKGRKRKQLLLFALIFPGIGLVLCFAPSFGTPSSIRWALLVAGMLCFFVGYTFYAIPYWSLIADYSGNDADLRRQLSNLLGAGILIATAVGFVISPIVIEKFGYLNAAIIFAILSTIGMIGPYLAEPRDLPPPASATTEKGESLFQTFLTGLKNPRFLGTIILLGGSQMSLTIMTSASPFIADQLLGGSEMDVSKLLGPLLGTALPCFLIAPALSRRFGWEKVLLFASLLLGLVYCACSKVGVALIGTPFLTAAILFGLAGPMIAVLLALEGEAITDCANDVAGSPVSIYFGLYNLVVKALNGVAIFMAGILAEASLGPSGPAAIRWMIFSAGGSLFVGLIGFAILKRQTRSRIAGETLIENPCTD